MARKRVKKQIVMTTWQDIDNGLRELGELKRHVVTRHAEVNASVRELRAQLKDEIAPAKARISELEGAMKTFTLGHPSDLRARSKKLTFGEVALRLTRAIKPRDGMDEETIVERMEADRKLRRYLKVKKTLDKQSLKDADLSDEVLAGIGLEISVYDCFLAKPAEIDAHPTEES